MIAGMYSRVFVIELLTGVMKANVKRVEVIQEPVLAFFASIVERCEYLNLELQSLLECGFDLVYFFLSSGVTDAVHKLLSIITSVTRLAPEVFQAVASIIASGRFFPPSQSLRSPSSSTISQLSVLPGMSVMAFPSADFSASSSFSSRLTLVDNLM